MYRDLARDPRDVILRVLRAMSEELGASATTYRQESFHAMLINIPAISYTRHCVSYLIS